MKNKDTKQSRVVIVLIALVLIGILLITGSMAEDLSFRFYQYVFRLTDEGLIESSELQTTVPLRYNPQYPANLLDERVSAYADREIEPGDMWEDLFSDALIVSDTNKADFTLLRFEGPILSLLSDELTGGMEVIDCRIEENDIMLILKRKDQTNFLRIIEWENNNYCITDSADFPDFVRIASRWSGTSLGDLRWKDEQYYISLCKDPKISWRISMIDEKVIEPLFLWDQGGVLFHGNFLFCDHDLIVPITEADFESYQQKVSEAFSTADSSSWMTVIREDKLPVPVYAEPSVDSTVVCELLANRPIYVLEQEDGWVHIQLGNVLTGFISEKNVEPQRDENNAGLPGDYINIDIEDEAPIYAKPDAFSPVIGETGYMRTWIIGIYNEEWYLVMTRDGQFGFLRSSDTSPANG